MSESEFPKNSHEQKNSDSQENVRGDEGILREVMQGYVDTAKHLENSSSEYERELYQSSINTIKELRLYLEQGYISEDEFDRILAGRESLKEIEGLKDSKTGLFNQNGFETRLGEIITHIKRRPEESLTVAYLDLKGFKQVNDTLGHSAGDKILSLVGNYLSESARGEDVIARFGGDEFGIAFHGGDLEDLQERFGDEYLQEGLTQYVIEQLSKSEDVLNLVNKTDINLEDIAIQARIGFARFEGDDDVRRLVDKADAEVNRVRLKKEQEGETSR